MRIAVAVATFLVLLLLEGVALFCDASPLDLFTLEKEETKIRRLVSSAKGGFISDSIRLVVSSLGGLGVISVVDIDKPGTALVEIPADVQLAQDGDGNNNDWRLDLSQSGKLALRLLTLRFSFAEHKQHYRDYEAYLGLLPKAIPNAAHYDWEIVRLSEYQPFIELAGSIIVEVEETLHFITENCAAFDSWNECLNLDPQINVEEQLRWAFSIVLSRGFCRRYELDENATAAGTASVKHCTSEVLAPFDFFNHAPPEHGRNTRFSFRDDGTLVFSTSRPIVAGVELLIQYHNKCSSTVLVAQYGFLVANNELDTLDIYIGPNRGDPNFELKRRILSSQMMDLNHGSLRRAMSISTETMTALRLVSAIPEEFTAYNLAQILDGRSIGPENDIDSLFLLHDTCFAYAKSLAVSLENDDGALHVGNALLKSAKEQARDLVLRYRLLMLQFALDCAEKLRRALGPSDQEGD